MERRRLLLPRPSAAVVVERRHSPSSRHLVVASREQVDSIQKTLGASSDDGYASDSRGKRGDKPGIDVVLGSQWGDEGKGKLVDMLSQVR